MVVAFCGPTLSRAWSQLCRVAVLVASSCDLVFVRVLVLLGCPVGRPCLCVIVGTSFSHCQASCTYSSNCGFLVIVCSLLLRSTQFMLFRGRVACRVALWGTLWLPRRAAPPAAARGPGGRRLHRTKRATAANRYRQLRIARMWCTGCRCTCLVWIL